MKKVTTMAFQCVMDVFLFIPQLPLWPNLRKYLPSFSACTGKVPFIRVNNVKSGGGSLTEGGRIWRGTFEMHLRTFSTYLLQIIWSMNGDVVRKRSKGYLASMQRLCRFLFHSEFSAWKKKQKKKNKILLFFRSCYSTAVAMTTCKITSLGTAFSLTSTGRKKREADVLIQNPILKIGDQIVPYKDYIDATKVSLTVAIK